MGEYWRYFYTDGVIALSDLETGFRSLDARFALQPDAAADNIADLAYGDDIYAEIEINSPQGELFQDDVEMLREQLADAAPDDRGAVERIEAAFANARGLVALRPTDFGIVYFDRIAPIWDWLMARWPGLLQIDDDGYYDRAGTVLALEIDDE